MVDTVFLTGDAPDGLRVAAGFFVPFAFEAAFAFAGAFFFAAEDVTAFFFTGAVFFFVAAAAEGVVVLVFAGVVVFFLAAFVFAGVVFFFAAAAEGGAAFVFFFEVVEFDAFLEALAIFFEDVTFLGFPPLLPPLFVVPAIVDQILALTVVYQKPYTINSIIYLLRIYVHHA